MGERIRNERGRPYEGSSRCLLEWGRRGAATAAGRGDVVVIVDTLSFATAVATATHYGAVVYPCTSEHKQALAQQVGAVPSVRRVEVPREGRFSLSPLTFVGVEAGTRVALSSPNGAECCRLARGCPHVVVGCLVNARAVATRVGELVAREGLSATVLACGERWPDAAHGEELRVAVEDYLGAGAIISSLDLDLSPEAHVCRAAFLAVRDRLEGILLESDSGAELRAMGFADDVRHAAQLDLYESIPVLTSEGALAPAPSIT